MGTRWQSCSGDIVKALNNGASVRTYAFGSVPSFYLFTGSCLFSSIRVDPPGIKTTLVEIIMEEENLEFSEAMEKFERIMKGRYATDVFE